MPVILPPDAYDRWLANIEPDPRDLLVPFPSEQMRMWSARLALNFGCGNSVPGRRYGVCTVLVPAQGARLFRNGIQAAGQPWKREREGRPFCTSALAFSESWTDVR